MPHLKSQSARVDQFTAKVTLKAYHWAWQKVFVGKSRIWLAFAGLGCLLQAAVLDWHIIVALQAHTGWHGSVLWYSHYRSGVDIHRYTLSSLVTTSALWSFAAVILIAASYAWRLWRRPSQPLA